MNRATKTGTSKLVVAAVCVLASVTNAAPTILTNGVAVTGISGAAASETFYRIDVPAGQDTLEIVTSGGTGDVDLYVRKDMQPTITAYDYRPYKPGNEETVDVDHPAAGSWYIMLRGYTGYTGVTLKATYSASLSVKALTNGVPVTGISGPANGEIYYSIDVPAGQKSLEIKISGGTGDADLYVKKDSLPTTTSYDYRPYQSGNNETVNVDSPAAATWYIMLRGYTAYNGLTLVASYAGGGGGGGGGGTILDNDVPVPNLSGVAGSEKLFRFDLPAGQKNLEIKMSGGTGDADLYVKRNSPPTTTDYDYRPYLTGNNETVTVDTPAAGTWFVMMRGYTDYSGVTLKASWGTGSVTVLQDEAPVTNLSGAVDGEAFFRIDVPGGQTDITFVMSGGSGNADMYIRKGAKPTTSVYDFRPAVSSGNNESIYINSTSLEGTWYVMLKGVKAYDGVQLVADYTAVEAVTTLTNGVPVNNLSGVSGTQLFFSINVPAGQTKFEIRISGGSGDADLYVRKGSKPSLTAYDYRPYLQGNDEGVTLNNPTAGTWFIMVRGRQAFSGVTLLATYGGTVPEPVTTLQNGVAVTGIQGAGGSQKFYRIDVPAGQAKLDIVMSGGTGDADMYVRRGVKPTLTDFDYRPYLSGNNESVSIDSPAAATWYILLNGYVAFDGVTLKATYSGTIPDPVVALQNGVAVTGQSGASASEKFYKIDVPAGQNYLTIETSGGTGDVDLYVKKGSKPSTVSWDYRPYLVGNNERVDVTNPAAATWYIMLRGYQTYAGVTLKATYGTNTPPPPAGNNFASDTNCIALYRLEPADLTADSIGSNTLTNINVAAATSDYREGSGCAKFHLHSGLWETRDWLSIADAGLSSNFPGKSGTSNKRFSLTFWAKLDSLPPAGLRWPLVTKANWDLGRTTYALTCNSSGQIGLDIGDGIGLNTQSLTHGSSVRSGQWYHIGVTFDNATHTGTIRIWDATAAANLGTDAQKTNFPSMGNGSDAFMIGSADGRWYANLPGRIDEVVVFNDVLTADDVAKIHAGTYGKSK